MDSILVTGANGFVGAALCRHLESSGRHFCRSVRIANQPGEVEVGSISGSTDWSIALTGCGSVIHLAARVHMMTDRVPDSLAAYREVNTAGTLRLAEQAASAGAKRFVFLSSVKVNGEATLPGRPFRPSDQAHPVDPYGVSKREAEVGLAEIGSRTGMEIVVIRPPLIYGEGVRANFLSMMRMIERGIPLPLGCVTDNLRSFLSLPNLTHLLLTCLDNPAAANRTFMASDGEDLSTADLLRRLGAAMGRPARLLNIPVPVLKCGAALLGRRDLASRLLGNLQVDISETRDILGWRPPLSVDEGLRQVANAFRGGNGLASAGD
jgi:nucleoside-diphosphate-sugar epimerase